MIILYTMYIVNKYVKYVYCSYDQKEDPIFLIEGGETKVFIHAALILMSFLYLSFCSFPLDS